MKIWLEQSKGGAFPGHYVRFFVAMDAGVAWCPVDLQISLGKCVEDFRYCWPESGTAGA